MLKSYSIAEARNHLPEIVHNVEQETTIQLTRRGKPVAFLVSAQEYERLKKGRVDFWEAYLAFRTRYQLDEVDIDVDNIFANVRDRSPGREVSWE
mgnify:CR=1 FL=1